MLTVWDWQKKSKIAEIKTTNEVVLAVEFHPTDPNTIVTCGKSHIFFWTWSGNSLARKQGIFGVRTFFIKTFKLYDIYFIYKIFNVPFT
ncbi:Echinoderm microtubule-associated protein-like 4 [Liparis tanakae]|uniref:Echinoderm microtubule-associated protein-like 4 n=1 Tax=Liparis tanakae TaxID=230148 RepID=A0A4Z2DYP0_9TELE|nr:Echinoderm microtubule-associated protein-like 4 [Liparis tanakae]